MNATTFENADCYFGDHRWKGGICNACGLRFRCGWCGQFSSVDDVAHVEVCRGLVWNEDRTEAHPRVAHRLSTEKESTR